MPRRAVRLRRVGFSRYSELIARPRQPSVAPTTASFASTSSSHPSPTVPSHISMRSTFSSRRTVPISSTMPENIAFACGARLSSTAAETTAALLLWLRLRLPAVVQAACEKLLPASVVVDSKRSAVSLFIGCQKTVQIARSHAASNFRGAVGTYSCIDHVVNC